MKVLRLVIVFFINLWLPLSLAHAAPVAYEIDQRHTNIMWFASHFGFSKSMGHFLDFKGRVVLDFDNPKNSQAGFIVNLDSVSTGLPKFDEHLKSVDFFNIEKYPQATFKSTAITVLGPEDAEIFGDLTLNGVTKQLNLEVHMNKRGTNPMNQKDTVGFTARGTILRSDFGIKYGLPGILDAVDIWIEAEAAAIK